MNYFNVKDVTENCIDWIRNWFYNNSGNADGILVQVSGGKDSSVVAKLCVEAIGKDRVFGLLMPNGEQSDIDDAIRICKILGINYRIVNIGRIYNEIINTVKFEGTDGKNWIPISSHTSTNIPPRIRMTVAYTIAQEKKYRVVGCGNYSEKFVGYCTKHADCNGWDFNPIACFTYSEVLEIGDYLGLPYELVHKTPSDGLCGKSDEDNFGFTYKELDDYIKYGIIKNKESLNKIERMHTISKHKRDSAPIFRYENRE